MTNVERSCDPIDKLILRDCHLDDSPEIASIYNAYIHRGGSTMDGEKKSAKDMQSLIQQFNERETILVLEKDRKMLGWGIIKRYSDRLGYRTTCETSVYLHPKHLRKGYGSRLKRALIERCKDFGYHHLVAKIFAENIASIAYNERLGYEVVGRQRQIGFIRGEWKDVVIMQLILNDVPPFQADVF